MTSRVSVRLPAWALLFAVLLLPAVAAVMATVFAIALVLGLLERLAVFLWRWPTFTIFLVMLLALTAVMIGAVCYER